MDPYDEEEYDDADDGDAGQRGYGSGKKGNILPIWGNQQNMNLNPLIMTNIQNSPYFKVNLFSLKTYHEVVDEIYYKVDHLEPWERGSRKTAGQTGMCGGVRGVGAGGIVSSCYCLLFKLFTLKLTRKQLNGLLVHRDSPYIRGIGFMYVRYTQPPHDLWSWFEEYLDDDEEIDVKAGSGKTMTMGEMVTNFMTKLEWFDTRFPRIPVNVQKIINDELDRRGKLYKGVVSVPGQSRSEHSSRNHSPALAATASNDRSPVQVDRTSSMSTSKHNKKKSKRSPSRSRSRSRSLSRSKGSKKSKKKHKERSRSRSRDRSSKHREHSRERERDRHRDKRRNQGRLDDHKRSRSRERKETKGDYTEELRRYAKDMKVSQRKGNRRSRSRSAERRRR